MRRTTTRVSNGQNVIDSRDVIARIKELELERETLTDAVESAKETLDDARDDTSALSTDDIEELEEKLTEARQAVDEFDLGDEGEELKQLRALEEECQGYCDWPHGEALIRDSYFTEYAQELAEDIGAINKDVTWPNDCIDWEKAAEQLQQDYSMVDFDGVDYWIRS